jgi:hypothetical protein
MWPPQFGIAQPLFNWLGKRMLASKINEKLVATGLGRHTREEIIAVVNEDLNALSQQLGGKPYLMGEEPTKV